MNKSTSLPFTVSIVMQRVTIQNRWESFQWKLLAVLPDIAEAADIYSHNLPDSEQGEHRRCLGFSVDLYADEAPGYFLNLSADTPCWFVMWRLDVDETSDGQEVAIPKAVTLSYNEAARWMDAGEQVDTLELSEEVAAWLATYTQEHYQPEVKKKRKHPSFEGGAGVDKMARAEQDRS